MWRVGPGRKTDPGAHGTPSLIVYRPGKTVPGIEISIIEISIPGTGLVPILGKRKTDEETCALSWF